MHFTGIFLRQFIMIYGAAMAAFQLFSEMSREIRAECVVSDAFFSGIS